jgi:hypothetical protein
MGWNRRRDKSETPEPNRDHLCRQANHLLWTSSQCLFATVFDDMCVHAYWLQFFDAMLFFIHDYICLLIHVHFECYNMLINCCVSWDIVALFHIVIWINSCGGFLPRELSFWYCRLKTCCLPPECGLNLLLCMTCVNASVLQTSQINK